MRKHTLLIIACLFSTSLFAQVQLVSTNPANGDVAVDQDSIVLEFNQPVMVDTEDPESSGFFFFIEPDTMIQYNGISLSEDQTKVILSVNLSPDTDYLMGIGNIFGLSGDTLETPALIQFTTYAEAGPYTVTGTVPEGVNGTAVFLSADPFFLSFDEEPENGEGFIPVYGAMIDGETGTYTISGVRENAYFPTGFNLFQVLGGDEMSEFFVPDLFIYDPDQDLLPNFIEVNATTTTNDILSGIDLTKLEIAPITFSEAIAKAQPLINSLDNDPVLLGGETFYFSFQEISEEPQMTKQKSALFSPNRPGFPSFYLPEKPFESERKNLFKAKAAAEDDFLSSPDGTHLFWEIYLYDAVKDSGLSIISTPFGVSTNGYFGTEEAELPEGVDFSDIKPLPETYLDSDAAVSIFLNEGISDLMNEFESFGPSETGTWFFDVLALNYFWEYEPDPTPNAPVMWVGNFEGFKFNYETEEYSESYLTIFLDIQTGEVLYKAGDSDSSSSTPLLFSEALELAEQELALLENTPLMIGGSTTYYYQFDEAFKAHPEAKTKIREHRTKPGIATLTQQNNFEAALSGSPDGYQTEWTFYGYDAEKDSALGIQVMDGEAYFDGYFGLDEAELPEGVTFDSFKPLPQTFVDSDQALSIIEAEGGANFREQYGYNNETGFGYWELWLDALHDYWEYPPDPTPNAPVMWVANYYGYTYNYQTEAYTEDSLMIFLDIETGNVLHKITTSSEVDPGIPSEIKLHQNYPNPFNPSTHIPFELNRATPVTLNIYNMLGQKIATLVNDTFTAGNHTISWDASELASGIYFYRLEAGGVVQTRKLMLLK